MRYTALILSRTLALYALVSILVLNAPAQRIVASVQWEHIYNDSACAFNCVVSADEGGYLLGGRIYDIADDPIENDGVLVRVGPQGEVRWRKTYGASGNEAIRDLRKTSDGGFIFLANSNSPPSQLEYAWVVKVDGEGNKQWEQTYAGYAVSILPAEGGYLIAGEATWLAKLSASGGKQWDRFLSTEAGVHSARHTSDGGFILAGSTHSGSPHFGDADGSLIKVDAEGNEQWERFFGGTEFDSFYSVDETDDGGFILAGRSSSPPSGNKEARRIGAMDYWIVKVDAEGNKDWDRSYGMDPVNVPNIRRTTDEGYVFNTGSRLIKIDSQGSQQWDQPLGRLGGIVEIKDFEQTGDGGYIVCGFSWLSDTGIPAFGCDRSAWAAKLERFVSRSGQVVTWKTVTGVDLESVDDLENTWVAETNQILSVGAASAVPIQSVGPQRYYRLRVTGTSNDAPSLSFATLLSWPANEDQKLEFSSDKGQSWQDYAGDQSIIGVAQYALIPQNLRNLYFRTRTQNAEPGVDP